MRSVGVPQRVRRARADAGDARAALERAAHVGRREPAAAHAQEQRLRSAPATRGAVAQPLVERLAGGLADGHDAARGRPCRSRAAAGDGVVGREIEPADLARAQAAAVQELEDRAVAQARAPSFQVPSSSGAQSAAVTGSGSRRAGAGRRARATGRPRARRGARGRRTARAPTRAGARRRGRQAAAASWACQRRSGSLSQVWGASPCCARKPQSSPRSPRSARSVCGESPCARRAATRRSTAGSVGMFASSLMTRRGLRQPCQRPFEH